MIHDKLDKEYQEAMERDDLADEVATELFSEGVNND